MKSHEKLLLENKAWAAEQIDRDPEFFLRNSDSQSPEFLWIGCSDSRVPTDEITNTTPGEIFVHRNIANLVVSTDLNFMSVLQYAVQQLKVKHVIVCGHYGCGGVKAALADIDLGLMNEWLSNIKSTQHEHQSELDALHDYEGADRLSELSVIQQVTNLSKTEIIKGAWKGGSNIVLHGWIYRLTDGLLNELVKMEPHSVEK